MECDYSSAYVSPYTAKDLGGHGVCSLCSSVELYTHSPNYQMTFTIRRDNDIVRPVSLSHFTYLLHVLEMLLCMEIR